MADLLTSNILTLDPAIDQCRLTLETGVSVSTTDQTAKTAVFLTPHVGNRISLFDGTNWRLYALTADKSLALGTLTSAKNYDIFAVDSSGNVAMEFSAAWASDTARTDALTTQDGVLVKSGSTTKRYLGTIRTTSTTETADSGGYTGTTQVGAKRFLYNYYNRVRRPLKVIDTVDSYSYTTNTWRVANGATGPLNCVEYVTGYAATALDVRLMWQVNSFNNSARGAMAGLGLDSTSAAPVGFHGEVYNTGTAQIVLPGSAFYVGAPGLGYHYFSWMEKGADGTCTFYGDNAGSDQCGIAAWIEA
jgi:hypothetical protein